MIASSGVTLGIEQGGDQGDFFCAEAGLLNLVLNYPD